MNLVPRELNPRIAAWIFLITTLVTSPCGAGSPPDTPEREQTRAVLAELDDVEGSNAFEKLAKLYERGELPQDAGPLTGWFVGRWVKGASPHRLQGALLGVDLEYGWPDQPPLYGRFVSTHFREEPEMIGFRELGFYHQEAQKELERSPNRNPLHFDYKNREARMGVWNATNTGVLGTYRIRVVGRRIVVHYSFDRKLTAYGYFFRRVFRPQMLGLPSFAAPWDYIPRPEEEPGAEEDGLVPPGDPGPAGRR